MIGSIAANCNPDFGIAQFPTMGVGLCHDSQMDRQAREVLAENLSALMRDRPRLDTFKKIVAAGVPSNGTLDRIRRKKAGCSVDQLDALADVFDLEPWQLLIPGLQPNNPPIVRDVTDAERRLWKRLDGLMQELGELRDQAHTGPGRL